MSFSLHIINRLHAGFSTPFSEISPLDSLDPEKKSGQGTSQIKGVIRSQNNLLSHKDFATLCWEASSDDLPFIWQDLNLTGQFSAIIDTQTHWLLCTDPIRSYPLYYWFSGNTLTVSDAVLATDRKPNTLLANEFLWTGFVSGSDTLYKGVKQVLAGQCVLIHKTTGHIQSFIYAPHKASEMVPVTQAGALADLHEQDKALWDRFVEEIGNRPIWIPLSGGYDGRYILAALIQRGLKDRIHCYTYGRLGSFEMTLAKKIANHCEVPWTPVLFSDSTWTCFEDEDSQQFLEVAFSGSAVPQWMEWVAFRQLVTSTDVPLNAVIVPGHSGDFLGGSHLKSELGQVKAEFEYEELFQAIYRHHGRLISPNSDEQHLFEVNLSTQLPQLSHLDAFTFASAIEHWNVQNRQAKFIGNACQAYSWFGYDWKMPLWDYSYCKFWYKLPLSMRWNSSLYHQFLFDTYFKPLGIDFTPPVTITKQGFLAEFQKKCPKPLYNTLKNWAKDVRRDKVDFNGWQWLNDELQKHLDSPIRYRDREDHALLTKWLIQKFIF